MKKIVAKINAMPAWAEDLLLAAGLIAVFVLWLVVPLVAESLGHG